MSEEMFATHVISVKSMGNEIGIVLVKKNSSKVEVETVRMAGVPSDDDRRIVNAIVVGVMKAMTVEPAASMHR